MLIRRTVIAANQLQRAAEWIVRQSHPQPAAAPLLRGWVVVVACDDEGSAAIYGLAARGRSTWSMSGDKVWYLVETHDADRAAELHFAIRTVDQHGLNSRCRVIDGLVIDVAFRQESHAEIFEAALSRGLFT